MKSEALPNSVQQGDKELVALLSYGSTFAGKYVIDECLGLGSSSSVYRCHLKDDPSCVLALKVLHPNLVKDETLTARFRKEVEASYVLNHPNVVRSYDYICREGRVAYTMEYAPGGDLRTYLNSRPKLPVTDVHQFAIDICRGLSEIHKAGIVHRDLRAANIFIAANNQVKIADFGIARLEDTQRLTNHGDVIGAIDYVSPEYVEAGQLDKRSDIYALGLLMYEMLTKRYPFPKTGNPIESLMARLSSEPEPVTKYRENCPAGLRKIIECALRRRPEDRYQTAGEMLSALEQLEITVDEDSRIVEQISLNGHPALLEARNTVETDPTVASISPHARLATQRRSGVLVPLAVGFLSLALLGSALLFVNEMTNEPLLPLSAPQPKAPIIETSLPATNTATTVVAAQPSVAVEPTPVVEQPIAAQPAPEAPAAVIEAITPAEELAVLVGEPVAAEPNEIAAEVVEPVPAPSRELARGERKYIVVTGNTLSGIAARNRVTINDLVERNSILDPHELAVGTELIIPRATIAPKPKPKPAPTVAQPTPEPAPLVEAQPEAPATELQPAALGVAPSLPGF